MSYPSEVTARFSGRPVLSPNELLQIFELPSDISETQLLCALVIFQEEYEIAEGQLRPEDPMSWFPDPPHSRNPLSWAFARAAYEDRLSELNYHIGKARQRACLSKLARWPRTVRGYVLAHAGKDHELGNDR